MRWQSLFEDLEAQLERNSSDDVQLRADEERQRMSRLLLRDRLASLAEPGGPVRVRTVSGSVLEVVPARFGRDWMTGELSGRRRGVVVPFSAIAGVLGQEDVLERSARAVSRRSAAVADRLLLPIVLRELARRRMGVEVVTTAGELVGTIDRVGADHLDFAVHDPSEARRRSAVRSMEIVPLTAIVAVLC